MTTTAWFYFGLRYISLAAIAGLQIAKILGITFIVSITSPFPKPRNLNVPCMASVVQHKNNIISGISYVYILIDLWYT